jgi:hypothetical protein
MTTETSWIRDASTAHARSFLLPDGRKGLGPWDAEFAHDMSFGVPIDHTTIIEMPQASP